MATLNFLLELMKIMSLQDHQALPVLLGLVLYDLLSNQFQRMTGTPVCHGLTLHSLSVSWDIRKHKSEKVFCLVWSLREINQLGQGCRDRDTTVLWQLKGNWAHTEGPIRNHAFPWMPVEGQGGGKGVKEGDRDGEMRGTRGRKRKNKDEGEKEEALHVRRTAAV